MVNRNRAIVVVFMLAILVVLAIQACSAGPSQVANSVDFNSMLPPLPQDTESGREPSAADPETKDGSDNWDNSGNVSVDGSTLTVTSAADRLDWVMYRFTVGASSTVESLDVDMATTSGNAWVAVSDYGSNSWRVDGPYSAPANVDLSTGNYLSPGSNLYAVVLVYDQAEAIVNSITLNKDTELAGPDYVSTIRPFIMDNCMPCHSAQFHTSGVVLESYNGAVAVAATAASQVNSDHNGSYTAQQKQDIQDWVGNGTPLGAAVTYTDDMLPGVFQPICMQCHDSSKSGGERQGAPDSVNWDTYAAATTGDQPNHGNARAQAGTMPPAFSGLSLTEQQKQLFQSWIDSGWPE